MYVYGSKTSCVMDDEEQVFKILKRCYDRGLRIVMENWAFVGWVFEALQHRQRDRYNFIQSLFRHWWIFEAASQYAIRNQWTNCIDFCQSRWAFWQARSKWCCEVCWKTWNRHHALQIHRADTHTPMEEKMKALDDIIERGDARHIGAFTMNLSECSTLQTSVYKRY